MRWPNVFTMDRFRKAHPDWRSEFANFRIFWAPQAGRIDFVRFVEKPGGKHFFLVSVGHAGSDEKAWHVASEVALRLDSGAIAREQLHAERDRLCA